MPQLLKHLFAIGIIKISNAVFLNEGFEAEYDEATYRLDGKSVSRSGRAVGGVAYAVERDQIFTDIVINDRLMALLDFVFQGEFLYWGSDLSTFGGSSDWHRDVYTRVPIWKMAIYLEGSYGDDQTFLAVPGSHIPNSRFSSYLTNAARWPAGSGFDLNLIAGEFDLQTSTMKAVLPSSQYKINRGDIIIFDQRLLHAVYASTPKIRRLVALSFLPSWSNVNRFAVTPFDSKTEYVDYLLALRAAAYKTEISRVNIPHIGQHSLPIASSLMAKNLIFEQFEDDFLMDLVNKRFPDPYGTIDATRFINPNYNV